MGGWWQKGWLLWWRWKEGRQGEKACADYARAYSACSCGSAPAKADANIASGYVSARRGSMVAGTDLVAEPAFDYGCGS